MGNSFTRATPSYTFFAVRSKSQHIARIREGSFLPKTSDSKAFDAITDSLREAQLCKGIKTVGEGANTFTSERS